MKARDITTPSASDPRPLHELRETGLLWLINATVFHPRGYALALHHTGDIVTGWSLLGDGSEPWGFACDDATRARLDHLFTEVNKLMPSAGDGEVGGEELEQVHDQSPSPKGGDPDHAACAVR